MAQSWRAPKRVLVYQDSEDLWQAGRRGRPRCHGSRELDVLVRRVAAYEPDFVRIFDHVDAECERMFDLLQRGYKDARYDPEYSITRDELKFLAGRVEVLLGMVEEKCGERL